MKTYIRILANFKGPCKRRRLKRMLGPAASDYLIELWIAAAQECPSGVLEGWDDYDIACAADWPEDQDVKPFIDALIDCGWLLKDENGKAVKPYTLNGWPEVLTAPQTN